MNRKKGVYTPFYSLQKDLTALDAKGWELYHVAEDFAENYNLADQHRDRLIEMILLWYIEAGKYHLLPIDQDGKLHYAQNVVSAALLHVELTEGGVRGGGACSADTGSAVTPAYKPPFHFTGTRSQVTIDISGELIRDEEAEMRLVMAHQ